MDSDNYLTADELRSIIDMIERVKPIWEGLIRSNGPVGFDTHNFNIVVTDSNGEHLGIITWADCGPAYFPNKQD